MKRKLRTAGAGLLAAVAINSLVAIDASANEGGHFVNDLTHASVVGEQGSSHKLHFTEHGVAGEIGCNETTHIATPISETKTVTELIVTPGFGKCYTTPDGMPGSVLIDVNGCTYKFTVAKGTTDETEQTVHLQCPPNAAIKITHPNCTITIDPQTISTGITYTRKIDAPSGKHFITLDANAPVTTTRHGLCQIVGTNGAGTLKGALAVYAYVPKSSNVVNLTAT